MMVWKGDTFLSEKDLVQGLLYVSKDDYVRMYLGKTSTGLFVFYHIGRIDTKCNSGHIAVSRPEIQIPYFINMCNCIMQNFADVNFIIFYKGIPKLRGTFEGLNYTQTWKLWYTKSIFMDSELPAISDVEPTREQLGYVSARNLEVGRTYGTERRNTWVYLGRTITGGFAWCFIGNDSEMLNNCHSAVDSMIQFYDGLTITSSNKKIKRNNQNGIKDIKVDLNLLAPYTKQILELHGLKC